MYTIPAHHLSSEVGTCLTRPNIKRMKSASDEREEAMLTTVVPPDLRAMPRMQISRWTFDGPTTIMGTLFVSSRAEAFFASIILLNALAMCLQSQYEGYDNANAVKYHDGTADETWPGVRSAFDIVEWVVGIIFSVEVLGRFCVFGRKFSSEAWNIFDSVIVSFWFMDQLQIAVFGINPMIFRVLRLSRSVRLVRAVQWTAFGPLHLIIRAIKSSFVVFIWSLLLMVLLICTIAMIVSASLSTFIQDSDVALSIRAEVYEGWGSLSRATLTMFEITLGNWGPPCWLLTNEVSEAWSLFFLKLQVLNWVRCSAGYS